jgi:transcriptional regulator with PAS, ATPase and Fis domain
MQSALKTVGLGLVRKASAVENAFPTSLDYKAGFEAIIGHSWALMQSLDIARRAAATNATLLIRGETGTGKELLAHAVHLNSQRRQNPFITINCGAIPKELLESELFGHVRGSFTGAVGPKKGLVEAAHTGTLFLDEIGEMPLELQVKLLRVLQNGEIQKVGSTNGHIVDVRTIAATHRDLASMVEAGTFRQDLYYRLSVIPLEIPPLRTRIEDIPELVHYFFAKAKHRNYREALTFPEALMPYFTSYHWPGNVRELENVIERLVVLARNEEVGISDLPDSLRSDNPPMGMLKLPLHPDGVSLVAVEKELLLRALQSCGWNQTKAAKYLHISRKALMYRSDKHGIRRTDK